MIKKKRSPTYRATQKLFDCQAGRREGPIISIISQEPHAVCGPLYGVLWVRLEKSCMSPWNCTQLAHRVIVSAAAAAAAA